MVVNYAEYSYFKKLTKNERIQFFFELYDAAMIKQQGNIDLSKFFGAINDSLTDSFTDSESTYSEQHELSDGVDHVAIMIDDENIMIESNSLRALRHITYKFFESGYILRRDKETEKMFRKDKVTKYLRIFVIVDQISSLCTN
jgi:hypothetical protein